MSGLAEIGHGAVRAIERQQWLAPIEERLQRFVARVLQSSGRSVRNLLYGTWLGHPLHPVLTDVPVGAWTVAVCLDCLDATASRPRYARAADRSIVIGLVGVAFGYPWADSIAAIVVAAAAALEWLWRSTLGDAMRPADVLAQVAWIRDSRFEAVWAGRDRFRFREFMEAEFPRGLVGAPGHA